MDVVLDVDLHPGSRTVTSLIRSPYSKRHLDNGVCSLQAPHTAARTRTQAKAAFRPEDLERTFGNIEIFLATFGDNTTIERAAADLIAATLRVVEIYRQFLLEE